MKDVAHCSGFSQLVWEQTAGAVTLTRSCLEPPDRTAPVSKLKSALPVSTGSLSVSRAGALPIKAAFDPRGTESNLSAIPVHLAGRQEAIFQCDRT